VPAIAQGGYAGTALLPTPFQEGSLGGDAGLRRMLEMVCAAVRD